LTSIARSVASPLVATPSSSHPDTLKSSGASARTHVTTASAGTSPVRGWRLPSGIGSSVPPELLPHRDPDLCGKKCHKCGYSMCCWTDVGPHMCHVCQRRFDIEMGTYEWPETR